MTDTTPTDGLPTTWSESARETYRQIEAEYPSATAGALAVLFEACELIAAADRMQAVVDAEGLMIETTKGTSAAHPLIAEARRSRTAAMTHLRGAGFLVKGMSSASAAGSALVQKRWSNRPPRQ